jgi:predicted TIM-barrel fold metal-dependent hydrolase
MKNPKTLPEAQKPESENGWVRKCDVDDYLDRRLPIPTRVVSNEEFFPMPQTRKQRAVEHHLLELSAAAAKHRGMARRDFLRTACGMATAFIAMNKVFGDFFAVQAAEAVEPGAAEANKVDYFIFDVQTHHIAPGRAEMAVNEVTPLDLRRLGASLNPEIARREPVAEDLYLENYIKEVFLDSETDVACISSVPGASEDTTSLSASDMVRSREWINRIAKSPRMVSHGLIAPDRGAADLEYMHMQVEKLKIDAWKAYTGLGLGANPEGWWLDDERIAYPALELSRKLGVKNVCLHKGLALGIFNETHCHPRDLVRASKDFPDLNFLVYHSGFKAVEEVVPAAEDGFRTRSYVPWVSDLCQWRRENPHMTNVYMELGGTFAATVVTNPLICCHVLGMMIDAFGADHVLWGTDSIWMGSPQWQIEALRRLEMPAELAGRFGYAPLTHQIKRQIFGLNAARLYGVDPAARRKAVPGDYVEELKALYQQAGGSVPSNTQYGWVRA